MSGKLSIDFRKIPYTFDFRSTERKKGILRKLTDVSFILGGICYCLVHYTGLELQVQWLPFHTARLRISSWASASFFFFFFFDLLA